MHAADHRFRYGAARMAFIMCEPAVFAVPPLIVACFGDPDRIFGQAVESLDQAVFHPVGVF